MSCSEGRSDKKQNKTKTNICMTQLPVTVSAKQNQNISGRFNSGQQHPSRATQHPPPPTRKMCDALPRTEIDPSRAGLPQDWLGTPHRRTRGSHSPCRHMFIIRSIHAFVAHSKAITDFTKAARREVIKNGLQRNKCRYRDVNYLRTIGLIYLIKVILHHTFTG